MVMIMMEMASLIIPKILDVITPQTPVRLVHVSILRPYWSSLQEVDTEVVHVKVALYVKGLVEDAEHQSSLRSIR
jgi:hypothetical protein